MGLVLYLNLRLRYHIIFKVTCQTQVQKKSAVLIVKQKYDVRPLGILRINSESVPGFPVSSTDTLKSIITHLHLI